MVFGHKHALRHRADVALVEIRRQCAAHKVKRNLRPPLLHIMRHLSGRAIEQRQLQIGKVLRNLADDWLITEYGKASSKATDSLASWPKLREWARLSKDWA